MFLLLEITSILTFRFHTPAMVLQDYAIFEIYDLAFKSSNTYQRNSINTTSIFMYIIQIQQNAISHYINIVVLHHESQAKK
jgi:hypothetical protein